MQWLEAVGSALTGISTFVVALAALIRGPAVLRAWLEQRAEDAASQEQAATIRLERQRGLSGWSASGVNTIAVVLVTGEEELYRVARELLAGGPTPYVALRVAEGEGDVNRAQSLRQIAEHEGYVSRPPSVGEKEALRIGLDAMGVSHA